MFFFVSAHAEPVSNFKGSLSVNQGTLNYDVGIEVPSGVAGVAPKLSLSYNSNRGNGYIGQGWSISGLSSITRCGSSFMDDGINKSIQYNSEDNYCMDGKKLVPISGERGAVGTEYRTQIASYTKILSIGGSDGNPDKFKVWLASGEVYEYGLQSEHIEKVSGVNNTWMLSKISNRYDNTVLFDYYNFEDKQPTIKSIVYSNGLNSILFNYSDREDIKSSFRLGTSKISSKKLESIITKVNDEEVTKYLLTYNTQNSSFDRLQLKNIKKCKGEECSRPLEFTWQNLNSDGSENTNTLFGQSYTFPNISLEENSISMADFNNDGLIDIYEIKESANDVIWFNDGNGSFKVGSTIGIKTKKKNLAFVDFNDDGFVDILEANSSIYFNSGNGTFDNSKSIAIKEDIGKLHFIDLDSDGDKDIYQIGQSTDYIWNNDGTGGFSKQEVISESRVGANLPYISFSDVDGDGDLDIVRMVTFDPTKLSTPKNDEVNIYINSDNDYTLNSSDTIILSGSSTVEDESSSFYKTSQEYFMDFNGDGKIDILSMENSSNKETLLYLSDNSSKFQKLTLDIKIPIKELRFANLNSDNYIDIYQLDLDGKGDDAIWMNNGVGKFIKNSTNPSIPVDVNKIAFVDVSGDGIVDIFDGKDIWINDGSGVFSILYSLGLNIGDKKISFSDFNGDSSVDIAVIAPNAKMYVNQLKPALITEIKDAFDNIKSIEYKNLTDNSIYTKSEDIEESVVNIQTSKRVVSAIGNSNGIHGTVYQYHGLKRHKYRGSLGFKSVSTLNQTTQEKSIAEYFQQFPLTGRLKKTQKLLGEDMLSKSEFTIDVIEKGKQYLLQSKKSILSTYLNGQHIKDTITEFQEYDEYGNPLKVTSTTKNDEESYTKIVTNEYSNNTEAWILGKLTKTTAEHSAYNQSESITRSSTFTYYPNGSLKSETIGSGELQLTKSYEYDAHGNRVKDTISSASLAEDRVVERTYDTEGRFLLRTKNPLGHTQQKDTVYDVKTGAILENTDVNGLTTKMEYNTWGQIIKQISPDGRVTEYEYAYDTESEAVKYTLTVKKDGIPDLITYYDSYGKKLRVQSKRFDGKDKVVDTYYNSKGQVEKKSFSFSAGETPEYSVYKYNKFGKLIETEVPAPTGGFSTLTIEYDGLKTTRIDAKGNKKVKILNILGKLKRVEEGGTSVDYYYDSIGNLIKTVPNEDEAYSITMRYDTLGRKSYMKDPDMGEWSYSYDVLGNLISQTDAKGQTTTFKYDILGRKIEKTTVDGTSNWYYDTAERGIGKIAKEQSDEGISKYYIYDEYGRVSDVKTIVDNKQFDQSFSYRDDGKLDTVTQPNGFKLIYGYNEQGYLESIKSPAEQIQDFDFDHFESLIEKTLADSLANYKRYLSLSNQSNRLIAKANYYRQIANNNGQYANKYRNYANRLIYYSRVYSRYAKTYYSYYKTYSRYSSIYRGIANRFYRLSFRYHRYRGYSSWLKRVGNFYARISLRYNYYANRYAYYSNYYRRVSQLYAQSASKYMRAASFYENREQYFYEEANKLYAEANRLYIEAQKYKRLSNQSLAQNQDVVEEYKEILADSDYVYHYKVMRQDSQGRVTKYLSGNGLVTENKFDKTGVMLSSKTGYNFEDSIRELNYEYDDNFNLVHREDKKMGIVQNYVYDELDRISYSTIDGSQIYGSTSFEYEYDVHGNLISKNGTDMEYYEGTHRVKSAGSKNYEYDVIGNMINSGDSQISYNAINKPSFIEENNTSISFRYDMNDKRYKKTQDGKTTYYIGKAYEYIEDEQGADTHKYLIYANGKVITVHTETQVDGLDLHETRYLHYDSLGSVDTITNQTGDVVQRMAYKPFGEQIDVTKPERTITNRGYTGHEHIDDTSLIHMNARVYDPTIGRFLSADTIIPAPDNSQGFNRYSYVLNNPLRYVDPSGHSWYSGVADFVRDPIGTTEREAHRVVEDIEAETERAVDNVADEFNRVVDNVSDEARRAGRTINQELDRWWQDIEAEFNRNGQFRDIVGGVVMVVGAVVGVYVEPTLGGAIMGFGASIIDYDPNEPGSMDNQMVFSYQAEVADWGGYNTPSSTQQSYIDSSHEESARIAGYTSGASTTSHPLGLTDGDMTSAYNNSRDGADLAINGDPKHPVYTPSSPETVAQREADIQTMYALVMDSSVSQDVKDVLTRYNTTSFGTLEYVDNPYVNRTGEFSSVISTDQIFFGAHRTAVTGTSPNGRAIQYTGLMWEPRYGAGFMSDQFISTYLHEALHRAMRTGNHPPEFYERVNREVENFYDTFPLLNDINNHQ